MLTKEPVPPSATTLLATGNHVRLVDPERAEDVCLGVVALTTGRTVRIRLVDALPGDWVAGRALRLEVLNDGRVWAAPATLVQSGTTWVECTRPRVLDVRERRAHPRVACRLPVRVQRLRPNGVDPTLPGRACDLGQGGMLLAGVDLSVGDVVELDVVDPETIDLRNDPGLADADAMLTVRALVVGSRVDAAGTHYAHVAFATMPELTERRLAGLVQELQSV